MHNAIYNDVLKCLYVYLILMAFMVGLILYYCNGFKVTFVLFVSIVF